MKKSFEAIGFVNKEENVSVLDHNILKNTFVIDINHPFPGYNGQVIEDASKPRAILFITKKKHPWYKIIRTSKEVNKCFKNKIDCSYANIVLSNKLYHAIRVKGLESYKQIRTVQNTFFGEGYKFFRPKKIFKETPVQMTIKKFFNLKHIGNNIFIDTVTENMSYFTISHLLNWELFRKITLDIKNNISNNNYDVVNGAFYMNNGIEDMIRIYKSGITIEHLNEIKKYYDREIKRLV